MKFLDANIIAYVFYNKHEAKCQEILRQEGIMDLIKFLKKKILFIITWKFYILPNS